MREVVSIFRHQAIEELLHVVSRGRIGILHDDDAATRVLNKDRYGSVAQAAFVNLRLNIVSDFVQSLAVGAHFELLLLDAHTIYGHER